VGVVLLNHLLQRRLGLNLLSLSFWFVVPGGALIGGLAAASGYYLAARWTDTMPSRRILIDMAVVGCSTWWFSHWLDYYTQVTQDGTPVRDLMSSWQYYLYAAEHSVLRVGTTYQPALFTTGKLGHLGVVREVLQLAGFILGGLTMYGYLARSEACPKCRRYLRVTPLMKEGTAARLEALLAQANTPFPGIRERAADLVKAHGLSGDFDLSLRRCPGCHSDSVLAGLVIHTHQADLRIPLARAPVSTEAASRLLAGIQAAR